MFKSSTTEKGPTTSTRFKGPLQAADARWTQFWGRGHDTEVENITGLTIGFMGMEL